MQIFKFIKWIFINLLLLLHQTECSSRDKRDLEKELKKLIKRKTNKLQNEVDEIKSDLTNIGLVKVSEVKELKDDVEELIVYAQTGLKNEKGFSRKMLNEILTSQKELKAMTSDDIAEMKIWLENMEIGLKQALEKKLNELESITGDDIAEMQSWLQNITINTDNCEAKLEENKLEIQALNDNCEAKLEENKLEIQALNDKLETTKQYLKSMEQYLFDAMTSIKQRKFERLNLSLPTLEPCEEPWVTYGFSCYLYSSKGKTWAKAQEFCNTEGGHLVEIDDTGERDFLVRTFLDKNYVIVLVGSTDKETEGTFVWQTSKKTVPKEFFFPGEPNDREGKEDCLHMYGPRPDQKGDWTGKLNDNDCSEDNIHFICEKDRHKGS